MRSRAVRKRGELVTYFAFDLLFHNGRDLRPLPLMERKRRLRKLIPSDHPRLRYVDHIEEEGEFVYKHAIANGLEGVVGKRADSPYVGGRLHLSVVTRVRLISRDARWSTPQTRTPPEGGALVGPGSRVCHPTVASMRQVTYPGSSR